jgi:CheY-like chemotaxis protein
MRCRTGHERRSSIPAAGGSINIGVPRRRLRESLFLQPGTSPLQPDVAARADAAGVSRVSEPVMASKRRRSCAARNHTLDAPRPDLVLVDLNMPRPDGRELPAVIETDRDPCTIPVVGFTTSNLPAMSSPAIPGTPMPTSPSSST